MSLRDVGRRPRRSITIRLVYFLLLIGFVVTNPSAATAEPTSVANADSLDNARMVRDFDLIALRNEMVSLRNPRVTKWARPLRVFVVRDHPVSEHALDGLRGHLSHLARLTGLSIEFVEDRRQANFEIVFTRESRFQEHIARNLGRRTRHLADRLASAVCLGFYRPVEPRNEILKAVVLIPVDRAERNNLVRACIVEETTQMMGLPNDSSRVHRSIFNDSSRHSELTWRDEIMLQILYHPRMTVGLSRDRAMAVAGDILPEILRERRLQALAR